MGGKILNEAEQRYTRLNEGESSSNSPENFALHVIRHLMCQMVKTAEEPDAAYEFITNLANNLKPKLYCVLFRRHYVIEINQKEEEEDKTFIMAMTRILEEIYMMLFYKALFKWLNGETDYTSPKGLKRGQLHIEDTCDFTQEDLSKGSPTLRAEYASKAD
ncbi:hypothetical protein HZH68_016213 [Vespula germanica]|uniref:Uncharacterized protein n=1 Tax=Vespula germanica TaxID=30212 RepID=A0A834J1W6_VESGE|nr:hypothetical protein HZH68_016213 [Vespula germanica]